MIYNHLKEKAFYLLKSKIEDKLIHLNKNSILNYDGII